MHSAHAFSAYHAATASGPAAAQDSTSAAGPSAIPQHYHLQRLPGTTPLDPAWSKLATGHGLPGTSTMHGGAGSGLSRLPQSTAPHGCVHYANKMLRCTCAARAGKWGTRPRSNNWLSASGSSKKKNENFSCCLRHMYSPHTGGRSTWPLHMVHGTASSLRLHANRSLNCCFKHSHAATPSAAAAACVRGGLPQI